MIGTIDMLDAMCWVIIFVAWMFTGIRTLTKDREGKVGKKAYFWVWFTLLLVITCVILENVIP